MWDVVAQGENEGNRHAGVQTERWVTRWRSMASKIPSIASRTLQSPSTFTPPSLAIFPRSPRRRASSCLNCATLGPTLPQTRFAPYRLTLPPHPAPVGGSGAPGVVEEKLPEKRLGPVPLRIAWLSARPFQGSNRTHMETSGWNKGACRLNFWRYGVSVPD